MIYIGNLNKAEVLFALYCGSRVRGNGFLAAREELSLDACREIVDPWWTVSTKEDLQDKLVALAASGSDLAEKYLEQSNDIRTDDDLLALLEKCCDAWPPNLRFDYLFGRVMKVDLNGNSFEEMLYDRDNGPGAAAYAVERVRKGEVR